MRHDNVSDVTPMLRARRRAQGTDEDSGTNDPATESEELSALDASGEDAGDAAGRISHGRVPAATDGDRGSVRRGRLTTPIFLATAATAVVAGAALVGPHLWTAGPKVRSLASSAAKTTTPSVTVAARDVPPANALTPPAMPSPAGQEDASNTEEPFSGAGIPGPPAVAAVPSAPAQPTPAIAPAPAPAPAQPQPSSPVSQPGTPPLTAVPTAIQTVSPAPSAQPVPTVSADTESPAPSRDEMLELNLAKQMAGLADHLATLEKQVSSLQVSLGERIGAAGGRMDELQHREDLVEKTLTTIQAATARPQETGPARSPQSHATPPNSVARPIAPTGPSEPARPVYHVQAGAPGIAILQDSSGNAIRVVNDDTVPGWGAVKGITQIGNAFVVHTEHGVIR